jgi:hypothetical protein
VTTEHGHTHPEHEASQWETSSKKISRLRAYVKTCILVYNQCLEERNNVGRGLKHDEQKHNLKSVSQALAKSYREMINPPSSKHQKLD